MDRLESRTLLSAPTIDGTLGDQVIADTQVLALFAGVVIDSPEDVVVTIEHEASHGVLAGSFEMIDGVHRFEGPASEATSALRGLRFDPTDGRVDVGETEETRFTITVTNADGEVVDDRTTVVSVAIDGTPRILGTLLEQSTTDTSSITPFANVQIASPGRDHAMHTLTIEMDNDAKGEIEGHGGFVTLRGTPDVLTEAIRSLVFVPASNRVTPGETETTGFTIDISIDGDRATDLGTTVISMSMNDAPVITGAGQTHLIGEHTAIAPFIDVAITDADRPGQMLEVTVTLDGNGSFHEDGLPVGDTVVVGGTASEVN
ncbi:MAG: hypothetical protein KDA28_07870, partial [Phycisphaerales bacterium]|nr:hypothetical protein [Phycisphaerales bacterium]